MAVGRTFPNEIDRLFNAPGGPIGRETRRISLGVARTAESLASSTLGKHPGDQPRTGRYQRSFEVRVLGRSVEFQIRNVAPYAAPLEFGADPHTIRARRVSHLRFKGRDGVWRRVKMVRHPGNPAYRILEKAAIRTMRQEYGSVTVS